MKFAQKNILFSEFVLHYITSLKLLLGYAHLRHRIVVGRCIGFANIQTRLRDEPAYLPSI